MILEIHVDVRKLLLFCKNLKAEFIISNNLHIKKVKLTFKKKTPRTTLGYLSQFHFS